MKRKKIINFLLLALSAAISSAQDTYEPNNYFNQAAPISYGVEVESFIWEPYDQDIYALEVASPGFFHIQLLGTPSNIDLQSFIYLPDTATWINANREPQVGSVYELFGSTCQAGTHYLQFRDRGLGTGWGGSWNQDQTYRVKVDFYPFSLSDPCECAGGVSDGPCSIASGDTISGTIGPFFERDGNFVTKDFDQFRFTISEPSVIKVEVHEVPGNYALDMFLFHPDNEQFWSDYTHDSLGHVYTVWATTCAIGDHFLTLRAGNGWAVNGSNAFNGFEPYSFSLQVIPLGPEEPCECANNSFADACHISLCDTTEALINPLFGFNDSNNIGSKDVDIYKMELDAGIEAEVSLHSVPDNLALEARVFDPSFSLIEVEGGGFGDDFYFSFWTEEAGVYYLEIREDGGRHNLEDSYLVTAGCNLINSLEGHQAPSDWRVFPNPTGGGFTVEGAFFEGKEVEVRVFSAMGAQCFFEKIQGSAALEIPGNALPPGVYYLQLSVDGRKYVQRLVRF